MAKKPKAKSVGMTMEQRKKLLLTPCKTKLELKNWVKYHTGFDVPDHTVSRYADTNPLEAIWQIYDICVNKNNPENIEELLYVAGRGSGKCVVKDTTILTNDGPKYIQNIKKGDVIWTGWSWQKVSDTFDEGMKPGATITTKVGSKHSSSTLTGSLKHRVQAVNDVGTIGWIHMKDLKPGQYVYKSSKSLENVDVGSEDFQRGWIVGVITGDGNVSRHDNLISVCGSDFEQLRHYAELVDTFFNIKQHVKRNSKKSVNVYVCNSKFRKWYKSIIIGELSYDKQLISLEHTPSFLAGFISGMMDTDGSKDSITLANPILIKQISEILSMFGVHSSINNNRRKPRYSKFAKKVVTYSQTEYKTKLPDFLMPLFSKRDAFMSYSKKVNEQFRYPKVLIKPFASYIRKKYEIGNGYWRLDSGNKTRSKIKYPNELLDSGKDKHICGHKIDYFIELANSLCEYEWADRLSFIRSGYYEKVDSVIASDHYFYDLEVAVDHAYWSNGFISHNTLGVAIAEFMVMLHDQRDVVHVGAIMSQAKRCYEYQVGFMLNDRIKSILDSKDANGIPILEKANMEKSIFNLTDRTTGIGSKVSLEVLPCTLKAVNGPHVPLVSVDEIDTVSGEGLRAFKDIAGMVDSRAGKKALRVGISTRKSRYGLMNRQIEEAEQAGRTVKRWTALEFSDRCDDDRSGTTPTVGYVMQDTMEIITEDLWLQKDKQKKTEYFRNEFPGERCLACPIAATCLGDAKNQISSSKMLKPVGDTIKKAKAEGPDWVLSQLFNLKPSVEGIIYKEFDEKTHVKNWNEMWKILTDQEYPGVCDHDIFVKKCFSSDTEVLTNNGFKLFKDLTEYDTVASLDDDGNLIYEKPTDYISYPYKGEMVNLYNEIGGNGNHLDMLITPNHDVEYLHGRNFRKNGKVKLLKKRADSLDELNDFYIPATYLADSTANKEDMASPIDYMTGDQYFAFLGLWLSEGSMSSARANDNWRQNTVSVSQSKDLKSSNKVDELMSSINWPAKLHRKTDVRFGAGYTTDWSINNKKLYDHLRPLKFAVAKRIPHHILETASNRQLEILLHWLCFGDGAYMFDGSNQQPYYSTGSEQLANDVQELCFRLGYKSSLAVRDNGGLVHKETGTEYLRRFRVNFHFKTSGKPADKSYYINNGTSKSEFNNRVQKNVAKTEYNDTVYCVTMPSTRLFVRRNGVISLSGNCHQMKLSCYSGIDWGWSNPSTVVYFFVDNRENVYVVRCEGQTQINNPTWAQIIKHKWHQMYRCQLYFPDLANPGDAVTMKTEGLPSPTEQIKDTEGGIQIVKKWLRSFSAPMPKMFFARDTCGPIILEFQMYHFKTDASGEVTDDAEKEYDHWLDALRYAMYGIFGKSQMIMGTYGMEDHTQKLVDRNGNFNRQPSAEEFARAKGINIQTSNDNDKSKLGKIGKKSELDDDDADQGRVGGTGAFLWSF